MRDMELIDNLGNQILYLEPELVVEWFDNAVEDYVGSGRSTDDIVQMTKNDLQLFSEDTQFWVYFKDLDEESQSEFVREVKNAIERATNK